MHPQATYELWKHYKDLDEGKWVKIDGWDDVAAAKKELMASVERFEAESAR